jgi:hypothetical protein
MHPISIFMPLLVASRKQHAYVMPPLAASGKQHTTVAYVTQSMHEAYP